MEIFEIKAFFIENFKRKRWEIFEIKAFLIENVKYVGNTVSTDKRLGLIMAVADHTRMVRTMNIGHVVNTTSILNEHNVYSWRNSKSIHIIPLKRTDPAHTTANFVSYIEHVKRPRHGHTSGVATLS